MSTVLPPRQETEVPVRITRESRRAAPYEGITEALKVSNLSHVYTGRSVLPPRFTEQRVPVINTDTREQVLRKGARLGKIERAADGYLESPFPTACLLYLKWSYLAKQCMALC